MNIEQYFRDIAREEALKVLAEQDEPTVIPEPDVELAAGIKYIDSFVSGTVFREGEIGHVNPTWQMIITGVQLTGKHGGVVHWSIPDPDARHFGRTNFELWCNGDWEYRLRWGDKGENTITYVIGGTIYNPDRRENHFIDKIRLDAGAIDLKIWYDTEGKVGQIFTLKDGVETRRLVWHMDSRVEIQKAPIIVNSNATNPKDIDRGGKGDKAVKKVGSIWVQNL